MGLAKQRLAVINSIREDLVEAAKVNGKPEDEWQSDEGLISMVFVDPRENGSMQLTEYGFEIMSEKFDKWTQEIPTSMTFANHTYLVNVSKFPYYVKQKTKANPHGFPQYLMESHLSTFDSNLGVLLKMVSGDFAQLERLLPRN